MGWVDQFILNTHCKGGRQTKTSILKLYKLWLPGALLDGLVPDNIIDANHMIQYLKYAATCCLLTKRGKEKETDNCLSQSLKKQDNEPTTNSCCQDFIKSIMIQAQRLCSNFDVTKGTILEYELHPEQFEEVTAVIFGMDQVNSIIKSHFTWNWHGYDQGDIWGAQHVLGRKDFQR
ncbi:hypothetical protein L208DRAFT_1421767 [Tricholoma matsutake]|nr:hypothetical protein L208DRAFT_1421767 [Tricholoma matsutake 945]